MQIWCRPHHQYLSLNSSDRASGDTHHIAALIEGGESSAQMWASEQTRTSHPMHLSTSSNKTAPCSRSNSSGCILHTHKPRTAAPVAAKILFGLGYCFFLQEKLKSVMKLPEIGDKYSQRTDKYCTVQHEVI